MPTMPGLFRPHGQRTRTEVNRQADQRRGSARERGYTTAWDKAARGYLNSHPLCEYCEVGAFGLVCITPATLVDHLVPHRGDQVVFWNKADWVASCAPCHSGPKQARELQGDHALEALAVRLGRRGGGGVKSLGPLPSGPAS